MARVLQPIGFQKGGFLRQQRLCSHFAHVWAPRRKGYVATSDFVSTQRRQGLCRVSRSFRNEYFRVFRNISESELDLLIPNIPNISEYFRI